MLHLQPSGMSLASFKACACAFSGNVTWWRSRMLSFGKWNGPEASAVRVCIAPVLLTTEEFRGSRCDGCWCKRPDPARPSEMPAPYQKRTSPYISFQRLNDLLMRVPKVEPCLLISSHFQFNRRALWREFLSSLTMFYIWREAFSPLVEMLGSSGSRIPQASCGLWVDDFGKIYISATAAPVEIIEARTLDSSSLRKLPNWHFAWWETHAAMLIHIAV